MRPRRQSASQWRARWCDALQHTRLQGIARGEMQPICPREQYFQWTLRQQGRADMDDYILPWPLFMAEVELMRMEKAEADLEP